MAADDSVKSRLSCCLPSVSGGYLSPQLTFVRDVVPAPRPATLQPLSRVLDPTTTDLGLPWPLLHGNVQGKRYVYGRRYAIVAIDEINASQNGPDRPTKRPCLDVEDVSFDT